MSTPFQQLKVEMDRRDKMNALRRYTRALMTESAKPMPSVKAIRGFEYHINKLRTQLGLDAA